MPTIDRTTHASDPFATRPAGHFATFAASNGDYHQSCDGVSNSMLSVFLDSPELFHGYYVSRKYQKPAPTPDMAFGSLVHEVLLEDGLSRIVEIPPEVLAKDGSRRGAAWHTFSMEHDGKAILKPEEVAPLREMRRSCEDHPVASLLLYEHDGQEEFSLEWTDDGTSLLLRSRIDRLVYGADGKPRLIVDVKTCAKNDAKSFAESCVRFGYARQARFYQRGVYRMTGEWLPFVFVAVRKTPPYTVECYDLGDDFLSHGEQELTRALSDLARRRDSDCWSSPTANQITSLSVPRWAKYESEWSIET